MKRYIFTLVLVAATLLPAFRASAQMKTAYFMEGSVQRLDMNAAFVPKRGYVNIPFIGNLGVDINSNFLSVRNFLYPNPDGSGLVTFMHGSVDSDQFLRRLRNRNNMTFGMRENILGFGGFAKRYFWSFGLNLRSETSLTVPKDFFALAKTMQEGEYNLTGFNATTDNFLEMAIGFAFPVYENITVGFRVKGLLGAGYARARIDNMHVSINDEQWRAEMGGSLEANVVGMDFSNKIGEQSFGDLFDFNDFDFSKIGSWGLAFDLGADARLLNDRLKVSVGINDLGFIAWSRKTALNGRFRDLTASFNGYDFNNNELDTETPEDILIDVTSPTGFTRMLTATLNIGGEYNILDNAIGFGLLSQTRFRSGYTSTELTVSANFRPSHWFSASLSHSLIQNRLGVFGLALNVHPSWINLFLGVDYLGFSYGTYSGISTIPINMKSLNFYFGLGIPLGGPRHNGSFVSRVRHR